MNKNLIMVLGFLLFLIPSVAALPLTVEQVEVDDLVLRAGDTNRLDLQRDRQVDVEVTFTPTQNVKDVVIRAFFSGFEFQDVQPLSDSTGPEDFDANVRYKRTLTLTLPDEVEEDNYRLRVEFSDRDGDETTANFNLRLDVPRHGLKIEDVVFFPGTTARAGEALLATVRLENKGEADEDDIKVTVSVPELGLSATEYIDEIEKEDEEETEEIFLRLPKCAEPGLYTVPVEVEFNEGHDSLSTQAKIQVTENPACVQDMAPAPSVQTQPPAQPPAEPQPSGARRGLEVLLVALIVILVVVGLVILLSKLKEDED